MDLAMELICRDFLLSWKCVSTLYHWRLTEKCMTGGLVYTDKHKHKHLACSCVDNTCRIHWKHTKKPGDTAQSDSFPHNMTSPLWSPHRYSQSSLKMNSSPWYLAQRTDYISPNQHQQLQATFRLCVGTEGLGSDTSHREEIRTA